MLKLFNTRIILSFVTLLIASALIIGGTLAWFSDSETSKGNLLQAGAIDLGIDNESYYNGVLNQGTTWDIDYNLSDNPARQFFNFIDLKPGDWGEDTISLHVKDNDSWLCADVTLTSDNDNGLTEPEGDDNDTTPGVGEGELADAVRFLWWADDGDNVLETCRGANPTLVPNCVNETLLPAGPMGNLNVGETATVALADFDQNIWGDQGPLPGGDVRFVGKAWCFGDFNQSWLLGDGLPVQDGGDQGRDPSQPGMGVVCDGSQENNKTQTDSFTADIAFRAIQSRHNDKFQCVAPTPTSTPIPSVSPSPAPVDLLSSGGFVIIAKTAITDAGPSLSAITGNIAIDPAAGSAITDVSCTNVTGTIYSSGGYTGGYDSNILCALTNPVLALAARSDMETAYTDAAGRAADVTELGAGNIGGLILAPGVYKWSTGVTIPTNVTLSGGVNDVWIFQISGTLDIASGGSPSGGADVVLIGGAQAKNVFWQVTGATTLGTYSTFNGTILAQTNIAIQKGAVLNGRALAQTAVTLDANTVTLP